MKCWCGGRDADLRPQIKAFIFSNVKSSSIDWLPIGHTKKHEIYGCVCRGKWALYNSKFIFLSRLLAPVSRICIKTGKRTKEFFFNFRLFYFAFRETPERAKFKMIYHFLNFPCSIFCWISTSLELCIMYLKTPTFFLFFIIVSCFWMMIA